MSGKTPKSKGGQPGGRADESPPTDAPAHAHLSLFQSRFLEKLKRRNVGRVAILYIVVCYLILEPFEMFFHLLDLPVWTGRTVVFVMVLGFPAALLFAWIYEITPDGIKPSVEVDPTQSIARQTGRKLDRAIIAVLAVALVYFVLDKFWLSKHVMAQPKEFHETAARAPAAASTETPATEAAFAPPAHSIAVLPFVNMSGDTTQDYFSDGISEEILNSLSRLNALQVAARTSSFSFKGQNIDITNIAHKLNVGAILEGSVRRTGNTVRITAQLINAVSGFHMWSETYDRKLTDILKVQADVATAVTQQLNIRLTSTETETLELGGTQNSAAYEAYLRGAQLLANWDTGEVDVRAARVALDQAIALDPKYALAYAKQSDVLNAIAVFIATPDEIADVSAQALRAAKRAVELAPELGEAHLALAGVLAYVRLDFASALPEFDLALTLSPGSANVQRRYAGFAGQLGRFQSAIIAGRRAVALDPQNVNSHVTLGQVLTFARRYDEALLAYRAAALVSPNSVYVKEVTSWTLLASGQFEQARQICDSIPPGTPPDFQVHCLVLAYHGLGRQQDAERELQRSEGLQKNEPSVELTGVYAQLGNKAAALRTLERAERSRESGLQGLRVNWALDPIRNEPQFKSIEARMNFPP
jgi:adenylate cyclase